MSRNIKKTYKSEPILKIFLAIAEGCKTQTEIVKRIYGEKCDFKKKQPTVWNHIQQLIEINLIHKKGKGGRHSNITYSINLRECVIRILNLDYEVSEKVSNDPIIVAKFKKYLIEYINIYRNRPKTTYYQKHKRSLAELFNGFEKYFGRFVFLDKNRKLSENERLFFLFFYVGIISGYVLRGKL